MNEVQTTTVREIQSHEFTREEIQLIKDTVARGATDNELKLFMHNCKRLGLDPFAKQVHFVKYGSSPGTIIVGLDGFRLVASRTGKHSGTKRGVLKNEQGALIAAWCEVYRSDWEHPAREEVPLDEYYNDRNPSWKRMPETMLKKVAECAALRMAFPAELSGVYGSEEMDQAEKPDPMQKTKAASQEKETLVEVVKTNAFAEKKEAEKKTTNHYAPPPPEKQFQLTFGRFIGKWVHELDDADLSPYYTQLTSHLKKSEKTPDEQTQAMLNALAYEKDRRAATQQITH